MAEFEHLIDPLFLMVIREKDKAEGEYKEALREVCEEFKPIYEKVVEEQKKISDSSLKAVKDYIFSEEMREQQEWEDLILYFEDEAGLEKHIKDNWESRPFMIELFSFFSEGVSVDCSEKLRKRFTLVCEIIAKLYLKGG